MYPLITGSGLSWFDMPIDFESKISTSNSDIFQLRSRKFVTFPIYF